MANDGRSEFLESDVPLVIALPKIAQVISYLESVAPLKLAEDWDNVGLLAGDPHTNVAKVMTCLTLATKTVSEATRHGVQLVVAHHPLPFRPLTKLVTTSASGKMLWQLMQSGVAIYSPHTAWDNARHGINARLAGMLSLEHIQPLQVCREAGEPFDGIGVGRIGNLGAPMSIFEIAQHLRSRLSSVRFAANHPWETECRRVAIVCGSGGSFLQLAQSCGADLLLTGEATYHQYLEAESLGMSLLTIGHYASEHFSMVGLAELMQAEFPQISVWASQDECDATEDIPHRLLSND